MSDGEEGIPMKNPKPASSASAQEVPIVTAPCPDLPSSMQAYNGGAFYASNMASPTPHPYMWRSQHQFMPPYGTPMPYPALLSPGGIFTHPIVPMNPNVAPANGEVGRNISDGRERTSNENSEGASGSTGVLVGIGTESHKPSSSSGNGPNLSSESGVDGSSDASEQNTSNHESAAGKKRIVHQMLEDGASTQDNKGMNPENPMDIIPAGTASAIAQSNHLDSVAPEVVVMHDGMMPDHWVHDEGELRRQKRKQSNRESARRSRLRKQADCDELQGRVDTLKNENHILKKELQNLSEECEKVTSENQSIKEELLRICDPDDLSRLEIVLQEDGGNS